MILTVALNPMVVREIKVNKLALHSTNESQADYLRVGDCGVYAAYILKVMQAEPYVMGISGGIGGRYIKNFLDKNRIKTDFLQVQRETKTVLRLTDDQGQTTILSHNEVISNNDFVNIKHKINHHIDQAEMVLLSGEDYHVTRILDEIHSLAKDTKKIVSGIRGSIIKPCLDKNIYAALLAKTELDQLGLTMPTKDEHYDRIREFQQVKKMKYLLIYDSQFITGFSKNKICRVANNGKPASEIILRSLVLGGLALGVKRKYTLESMMKLIGAITEGADIREYPVVISRKNIDRNIKKVKLIEIYNGRNGYR